MSAIGTICYAALSSMRSLRTIALVVAVALPMVSVAGSNDARKLAKLDDKNGFRDAKLGTDFAKFEGMVAAGKHRGLLQFSRPGDKLALFDTKLAAVVYAFKEAMLDRIVVTGAWTLDGKMSLCEGNKDHVAENLSAVFGKPTHTHSHSSSEGKRCVRDFGGGLKSPYCRVFEWRGSKVRLSFFGIVTTSPGDPPPDVKHEDGWAGHSCRFVLEYERIADPADEL
jgi:hypothetical protein